MCNSSIIFPQLPESYEQLISLVNTDQWCSAWIDPVIKPKDHDAYHELARVIWYFADFENLTEDGEIDDGDVADDAQENHDKKHKRKISKCKLRADKRLARYLITAKDPCLGLAEINIKQLDYFSNSVIEEVYRSVTCYRLSMIQEMLSHIIERGVKNNLWKLCYLTRIIDNKRDTPRTTLSNIERLKYGLDLYKKAKQFLSSDVSEEQITAALLLSSMLYDGCLSRTCLVSLVESLNNSVMHTNNSCWIDLIGANNVIYRRIYLSDISLLLLAKHPMGLDKPVNPLELIETIVCKIMGGKKHGFSYIRQAVTQVLGEFIPEVLIGIAEDKHHSQSLSTARWNAIMNVAVNIVPDDHENKCNAVSSRVNQETSTDEYVDDSAEVLGDLIQSNDLAELRKIIRRNDRQDIKNELLVLRSKSTLTPIGDLLAGWLIYLADNRKISVLKRFFSALGSRMIDVFGDKELKNYDDEDIGEILQKIVDSGNTPSNRNIILSAVKSFVDYNQQSNQGVESDAFVAAYEQEFASANIITADEHFAALEQHKIDRCFFGDIDITDLIITAQILFFRAGFRLRELIYLPRHDVFISDDNIEIWVRDHALRKTKTPTSERIVPLRPVLTDDEYIIVRDYLTSALSSNPNARSPYVFCFRHARQDTVERKVTKTITTCLRALANDDSITLHHLRHSFVTWLSLSLLMSSADLGFDLFLNHPKTKDYLVNVAIKLRQSEHIDDGNNISLIYLVSRLAGHVNPGTTIENYAHLMDYVLTSYLRKFMSDYFPVLSSRNSGIPERTLRRYNNDDILRILKKKLFPKRFVEVGTLKNTNVVQMTVLDGYKKTFQWLNMLCITKGVEVQRYPGGSSHFDLLHHRCTLLLNNYPVFNALINPKRFDGLIKQLDFFQMYFDNEKDPVSEITREFFDDYMRALDKKTLKVILSEPTSAYHFHSQLIRIGFRYRDLTLTAHGIVKSASSANTKMKEWRDGMSLPKSIRITHDVRVNPRCNNEKFAVSIRLSCCRTEKDNNTMLLWFFFMWAIEDEQLADSINSSLVFL